MIFYRQVLGILTLCLASIAFLGAAVLAQETSTSQAAEAKFEEHFRAYQDGLREIEQLRIDFQAGDLATREKINRQLGQQVAKAQEKVNALVAAALEAYKAAPGQEKKPRISELLLSVARYHAVGHEIPRSDGQIHGGGQFEKALPILQALLEGGEEKKELQVWAGLAAFLTHDYDLAEKLFQKAKELGAFVEPSTLQDGAEKQTMTLAMQYAAQLETYRQMWSTEQAIRAAEAKADNLPRVLLRTSQGDITIELFESEAPLAVANFISLVKQGFYDGLTFHRVLPGFMAQGGCPDGNGKGGPGHTIRCECNKPNARKHFRGSLSMAHAGPDTGGSQFFLTFVPTAHLDGRHTVFGHILEGIEVLGDLQKRNPTGDPQKDRALPKPDKILKAEVLRDGPQIKGADGASRG